MWERLHWRVLCRIPPGARYDPVGPGGPRFAPPGSNPFGGFGGNDFLWWDIGPRVMILDPGLGLHSEDGLDLGWGENWLLHEGWWCGFWDGVISIRLSCNIRIEMKWWLKSFPRLSMFHLTSSSAVRPCTESFSTLPAKPSCHIDIVFSFFAQTASTKPQAHTQRCYNTSPTFGINTSKPGYSNCIIRISFSDENA